MEIRNSCERGQRRECRTKFFNFEFRVSLFVLLFAVGCGAPGDPVPPSPPVPAAVADLAARQSGDGVELLFTLPSKSIRGDRLSSTPAVEILRGTLKADGSPDAKSFRIVYTIPGALVDNYRIDGRMRFTDPISAEETKAHPGATVAYLVRTRLSSKRASADSNLVAAHVFPAPEIISSVQTHLTEREIELNWSAPAHTSAGDVLPPIAAYHIYRGEIASGTPVSTSKDLALEKWISPLAPIATVAASESNYRDTQFEFGKTYVYVVRTAITQGGAEIESDASDPATVAAVDTFPPAAPQDIVAVVVPGATAGRFVVYLSWSLNLETDLAGYRVYRSEQEGTRGQPITSDLLPTPAVRDNSVEPGHRYWYTVTAVDRAGNESPPSSPIAADITQPSP